MGHALRSGDGAHYRRIPYDAAAAEKPEWVWLPNALVDGAAGEIPLAELIRQTRSAATLRLLIDLYAAQDLARLLHLVEHLESQEDAAVWTIGLAQAALRDAALLTSPASGCACFVKKTR